MQLYEIVWRNYLFAKAMLNGFIFTYLWRRRAFIMMIWGMRDFVKWDCLFFLTEAFFLSSGYRPKHGRYRAGCHSDLSLETGLSYVVTLQLDLVPKIFRIWVYKTFDESVVYKWWLTLLKSEVQENSVCNTSQG